MTPRRILLYGLVVLVLAFEGGVAALMLVPNVSDRYRAYYIDRTSDCWPLKAPGTYRLGATVSFVAGAPAAPAGDIKVCGWTDPADTGTWSVGAESRLRFRVPGVRRDLLLAMDLLSFATTEVPVQRMTLSINGEEIDTLALTGESRGIKLFRIPRRLALARWGVLDITMTFPDAISPAALGINQDRRPLAIRLLSLSLRQAAADPPPHGDGTWRSRLGL